MDKVAVAEILKAAESGDPGYPDVPLTGLRGESARLDHAQRFVFAEGDRADDMFLKLTETVPGSPLSPRSERLRLLRRNREILTKVFSFSEQRPHAASLFEALAAGPGPTSIKQSLEVSLTRNEHRVLVSDIRLGLAKDAPEVHRAEKQWLKKVGPYRSTSHLEGRGERFREWVGDNKGPLVVSSGVAVFFALMIGVAAMDNESPSRVHHSPVVSQHARSAPEPRPATIDEIMHAAHAMNPGYSYQPPQPVVKTEEAVRASTGVTLLRPVDPGLMMHTTESKPEPEKPPQKPPETPVALPEYSFKKYAAESMPAPQPAKRASYPMPADADSSRSAYFPVGAIGMIVYFIIRALKKKDA